MKTSMFKPRETIETIEAVRNPMCGCTLHLLLNFPFMMNCLCSVTKIPRKVLPGILITLELIIQEKIRQQSKIRVKTLTDSS